MPYFFVEGFFTSCVVLVFSSFSATWTFTFVMFPLGSTVLWYVPMCFRAVCLLARSLRHSSHLHFDIIILSEKRKNINNKGNNSKSLKYNIDDTKVIQNCLVLTHYCYYYFFWIFTTVMKKLCIGYIGFTTLIKSGKALSTQKWLK